MYEACMSEWIKQTGLLVYRPLSGKAAGLHFEVKLKDRVRVVLCTLAQRHV